MKPAQFPSYYHGYRMPQAVPVAIEDVKDLLAVMHPLDLAQKLCLRCPYTIRKWILTGRVPAKYFHRLGEIIQEVAEKKKREAEIAPSSDEIEFKAARKELTKLEKAKLELMRARKSRLLKEIEDLKNGIAPEDDGISDPWGS